ncbi:hypothetical protein M514_26030 [Trichuris suis]|uniref:Protein kinase domain-containing protein n=1 Tax=Trichuris suis TaxID=68888 RepID=A0A085MX38_9BILA|nr:hypothetical protein M514_26030 [Trichuris suis]
MQAKKRYAYLLLIFSVTFFLKVLWYSQRSKVGESADEANVAITWPAPLKRVEYKNSYVWNFTFKDTTSRPRIAQRLLKPCSMDTCFDYSRCRKRPLRVYIYPKTNLSGDAEPSSESYEKILQAIRDSKFYTKNPKEACLFILPWDTLSRDNLSPFYVSNMRAKIKSIPEGMWNNGVNHLIFNLYSGTWPNYDLADLGFDPGKAILAKASFSTRQYRRNYDVSLALFHQILPLRGPRPMADNDPSLAPSWVSTPSHYLLVFKGKRYVFGIGSETRNALYHLHNNRDVIMLTTCKHGKDWKRNQDERCAIDNAMYDRWTYEELMQNSSFCLVPRGRRLGSFRFLEALEKGCIPVILSNDWVLPFSEVIDWSLATVRADERTLFQIPSTLRSIDPSVIDRMRLQARHLYRLYFASVDKIVDTVLQALQIIQDRIWSWEKRTRLIWNSGIAGSRYHSVDFSDRLQDFPFYVKPAESARLTAIILCSRPWHGELPSFVEDLGKSKFIDKIVLMCSQPSSGLIPVKTLSVPIELMFKQNTSLLEVARNASTPLVAVFSDWFPITSAEVDYAVELWRWVPYRLIGFDGIDMKYLTKEKRWSLSDRNESDPYTLLTGNAIFFHRYVSSWVALDPPLRSTRKLVQESPDCWDTVLNYIVAEITGSSATLLQTGKAASRPMSLSSVRTVTSPTMATKRLVAAGALQPAQGVIAHKSYPADEKDTVEVEATLAICQMQDGGEATDEVVQQDHHTAAAGKSSRYTRSVRRMYSRERPGFRLRNRFPSSEDERRVGTSSYSRYKNRSNFRRQRSRERRSRSRRRQYSFTGRRKRFHRTSSRHRHHSGHERKRKVSVRVTSFCSLVLGFFLFGMISATMMTMMATKSSVSTSAPSKLSVVCQQATPLPSSSSPYGDSTPLAISSQRQAERNGWQLFGHSFLKELQSFANALRDFDDNDDGRGGGGGQMADRSLQLFCPVSHVPNDSMSVIDCGQQRHDAAQDDADIGRPPVPPPRRCRRAETANLTSLSQSEPNLSAVDRMVACSSNQDLAVDKKPAEEDDLPNEDNLSAVLSRLAVVDDEQSHLPVFNVEEKSPSHHQLPVAASEVQPLTLASIKSPLSGSTRCKNAYFQYPCPFSRNGYNNHLVDTAPFGDILPSGPAVPCEKKSKPLESVTEVASKNTPMVSDSWPLKMGSRLLFRSFSTCGNCYRLQKCLSPQMSEAVLILNCFFQLALKCSLVNSTQGIIKCVCVYVFSSVHDELCTIDGQARWLTVMGSINTLPRPYWLRSKKKHRSQRRSDGDSSEPVPPIRHDKDGHLACHRGDLILDKYEILDTLGEGTFGRVFEVRDLNRRSGKSLALKVIRNKRHYRESAQAEIDILNKLKQWDTDGTHLFVNLLHDFDYYGHVCLVFPKYGMSVFDFMKANNFVPYPMEQVRHIAYQLCFAVSFMHDHGLVHTDLKPENMIFVTDAYDFRLEPTNRKKEYRVMRDTSIRLIDFGATVFNRKDQTAIVSTRHYRAPEVILELGWSYPCDVWSIGCIIYELLKGVPMFQVSFRADDQSGRWYISFEQVHEDLEHLAMMQRVLGTLPQHMALKSKKNMFEYGRLRWDEHSSRGRYVRETLEPLNRCFQTSDPVQAELFNLISDMLQYPPSARTRLGEVLNHRFFRRLPKHLRLHEIDTQSSCARSSRSGSQLTVMASERLKGKVLLRLLSDVLSDDVMDKKTTSANGEFLLDGTEDETTKIDPVLKIYHDCDDGWKPCQRRWSIVIPDKYISKPGDKNPVTFNLGTVNLEGRISEDRNCV